MPREQPRRTCFQYSLPSRVPQEKLLHKEPPMFLSGQGWGIGHTRKYELVQTLTHTVKTNRYKSNGPRS